MRRLPHELFLALAVALVHGLIWVFIVPPWEHYDEPAHAEYAWLIANKGKLPSPDDVDHDMRVAFVRSMIRSGFYVGRFPPPDIESPNAPTPHIGYSQLEDSPLYYFIPAMPMYLLRGHAIETQLYAARLTSVLLFMLTVACAWGVAAALTAPGHPLRWMLPFTTALLPAFADLMTAVNSDVGAVVALSLFLWGSMRLMNPRGEPRSAKQALFQLAWVLASAALCLRVKGTSAPALALLPIVLLFSALRGRRRPLAWGLFGLASIAALVAVFTFGDASLWYRNPYALQSRPTRCDAATCGPIPLGHHAIQIEAAPGAQPPYLFQSIPPASVARMRGRVVTVGAWMWTRQNGTAVGAPSTVETTPPLLNYNYNHFLRSDVALDETPRFVAITGTLPITASYARLVLPSLSRPAEVTTTVMLDGIVLVVGEFPTDVAPGFEDAAAERGIWAGQPFENLARNASGEGAWIALRPEAERILLRFTPEWVSWILGIASLFDLTGTGWYHRLTAIHVFQTFWARFSWGNVPVADPVYVVLAIVTAASLLCTATALWRDRRTLDWSVVVVMACAVLLIWLPAIMRGVMVGLEGRLWLAGARYSYPAIIASLLGLTYGWSALIGQVHAHRRVAGVIRYGWIGGMVMLAVLSLITVARFYAARGPG